MNNKHKVLRKILSVLLVGACIAAGSVSAGANTKTASKTETPTEPIKVEKGDVNHDGIINSLDALLTLRQSVGYNDIGEEYLKYADYDGDGKITSADSLLILMQSVNLTQSYLSFPSVLNVSCGDRLDLKAEMVPEDSTVTYTYKYGTTLSNDGSGCKVLEKTNTGRIKAFHPGTTTVTVTASNGMTATCTVNVQDNITHQTINVGNNTLSVTKHIMLKNDAYDETKDFTEIRGIVVHSTATPGAKADIWYKAWNKPNTDAAVHAFLDDNGVYQYLPLEQTAWHAGQPANTYYLDFEICEPSGFRYVNNQISGYDVKAQQAYFDKIWKNATVYTAYLCKTYGLTEEDVISHAEAAYLGIGTHHGDPDHWFVLHNKDMDDFRNDVKKLLESDNIFITRPQVIKDVPNASGSADFDFFAENPDVTPFDMFKVWGYESLRY